MHLFQTLCMMRICSYCVFEQALTHFKDTTVLWTNRAQAYIKLRQYEKALTDCDWATRVSSFDSIIYF